MALNDRCSCGKPKPETREVCYDCMIAQEEREGKRCECGNRKSTQEDVCEDCEYN